MMTLSMRGRAAVRLGLALAAAGLAIQAYVHFDLASAYDGIKSSGLSQGDLFRAEATVAVIAAVAVLLRPRRYTAALALFAMLHAETRRASTGHPRRHGGVARPART